MPVAPARIAAFDILLKIDSGAGHSDDLLRTLRVQSLSPQDRNLCTNLVMGTLRWQIALDAQIGQLLTRPDAKMADGVRIALRLGAFQLLHLDRIPPHAAISESVELAKFGGEGFAAGMVNAVLRKIGVAGLASPPERFRNAGELAAHYAHPAWIVERWASFYGMGRAEQICRFNQDPPPTTIRLAGDGELTELALRQLGIELAPGAFLTRARQVVRGDVSATEPYRQGLVRIQDEGSQLVAELAGRGDRVLDCCAAPGGKTLILAERNPTASILAADVSRRRLDQMKRLIEISSVTTTRITFQEADAAQLTQRGEFDLVLCDVPCSGTGTLARNPEIRHRLSAGSLPRHHQRQAEILRSAMGTVAPGGRLVYATCSLEPEENEAVVEECLTGQDVKNPGARFKRVPFDLEPLLEGGAVRPEAAKDLRETAFHRGYLRTLPGIHPCDGFFAALLVKE